MRKLQLLLLLLIVGSLVSFGQVEIQNFNTTLPDTNAVNWTAMEGGNSITLTTDSLDAVEGGKSVKIRATFAALNQWGTYTQFGYTVPDGQPPMDISISDSVSIWVYVRQAPTHPEWMVFRLAFVDEPTPSSERESWIFEHPTILDNTTSGWVNLRVPLFERTSTGTEAPDSTGFIPPPSNWGGFTWNNYKFDRDKIVEWSIALVTSGWDPVNKLPADSIEVSFDAYQRFGARAVPAIVFNGKEFPSYITNVWAWGQSSAMVEAGAGPVAGSNAIKWTQGNEWNNGWTGWGVDVNPGFNLAGGWIKDSLRFKMKAESGVGALRAQFESASGKRGMVFTPTADNAWHSYAFALKDFTVQDGAVDFDSTNVIKFGLMAEGSGVAGKLVYITDLWTGDPVIDVIPPAAPANIIAAGGSYANVVTWDEVTGEPGVRYNVYFSEQPWDSVADPKVEDLPPYNLAGTLATHTLRYPVSDHDVTLYYGVVARDEAGNESVPRVMSSPVTTLAQGVPTISTTPPSGFNANGDLAEWSSITPFNLSVTSGTAHYVPNFPITGDADLSVKAYVAVDADNLYVAYDVTDDVVAVDTTKNDYEQDCPDIFIGLYDWRGKHHKGYARGATPDYHIRFSENRLKIDNDGGPVLMYTAGGNPNYSWTRKLLTPGYIVEAKIPFTVLAAAFPTKGDAVFSPKEGMRIPIDFAVNDRDDPSPTGPREGIMSYSTISNDDSWKDMFYWTYTWIGNQTQVSVRLNEEIPLTFGLEQNYPNPFNPSTRIQYNLAKPAFVTLTVYDILGREVTRLVNSHQEAGRYAVDFNTASLGNGISSGVFFYRLEAGAFVDIRKMMLIK